MANFNELCKLYDLLSSQAKGISRFKNEFTAFTTAAKYGSDKEKKFASVCIAKFAKFFPDMVNTSIEAMASLCQGENALMRMQALGDICIMCRGMEGAVEKVTYAVAKGLLSNDDEEVSASRSALVCLYQTDPMGTLRGLLKDLADDGTSIIRKERTLKALAMWSFHNGAIKPEAIKYIIQECKNILKDVTADEFPLVMAVFGQCRMSKSVSGHQELVDLLAQQELVAVVVQQCIFSQFFNPSDQEFLDRMLVSIKYVLPYFSAELKSTVLVSYILHQVLPHRESIQHNKKLEIFQLLAELSSKCGTLDAGVQKIGILFHTLSEYLPPPNVENAYDSDSTREVEFIPYLEPLMYAFQQLCKQHREFLTEEPRRMAEFRLRLRILKSQVQLIQTCDTREEVNEEEKKKKETTQKAKSNVIILILDLCRTSPLFKAVSLSFTNSQAANTVIVSTPATKAAPGKAAQTHHLPITSDSPSKKIKIDRDPKPLYVVPVGKFSSNVALSAANSQGAKSVANTNAAPVKTPRVPITWDDPTPTSNSRPQGRGRGYRR